jgi:hypothetical protein
VSVAIAFVYRNILSLSLFHLACCCPTTLCCTTHAVVENVLSIIAASVLLYFNALFLNDPYKCLFDFFQCSYEAKTYPYPSYDSTAAYPVKMICFKAELACAAVMLVTNVVYVLIFMVVAVKTCILSDQRKERHDEHATPVRVTFVQESPSYPVQTGNVQRFLISRSI